MRGWQWAGWVCLQWSSLAWAGHGQQPLPSANNHAAASTQAPSAKVERQLSKREAEVRRLRKTVDKQESDSRKASERLRQQDRAIIELRRQLQAIQATKPGAGSP
ncbi:MAG: hypothetical protein OQK79_12105 [Rhodanobacter sp.]|jgi:septal ring factor EnvC (AmiA/AmiB activator)|nr:hypothetical protein [Rhodanobacter sp.]